MADAFRGLTLRLGADSRPLATAINSIKKSAGEAQTQMNRLSKALKFDTTNVRAMESRLDLAGDKAAHTARQAALISTSLKQAASQAVVFSKRSGIAGGTMESVASKTKDAYNATNKLRQEYNHVDTELEQIYIAAARVKAESDGIGFQKALKAVRKLGTEFESDAAKAKELYSLIRSSAFSTDIADKFGLEGNIGAASRLVAIYRELHSSQKVLQSDLESMNKVQGYRAAQSQLAALDAELRQACIEAAQFNTELHSLGGTAGFADAVGKAKQLDAAVDAASASAKRMSDAFRDAPRSMEAARAKATAMITQQSALKSKLKEVENVIKEIGALDGFNKQKALLTDVWTAAEKATGAYGDQLAKVKQLEAEYETLEASVKEMGTIKGKDFSSKIADAKAQMEKLNSELTEAKAKLNALDGEAKSAALARKFREASEEAVELRSRIVQVDDALKRIKNYQQGFEGLRRIGYGLYTTLTQGLMRVGRYAIQSAEEIDSAYRDMRKTVNGTEEDFEALKQGAMDFASTRITSADQILEIESIGGQLGITVDDLQAFGETVSNLDIATNMDTEDIALNLAKLSNIMGFNQEQYDSFADALVRLGNNEPALESDIMQISARFAGMAANVGMTTQDVLAFSTAATATGQKAAAAGGAMQRTLGRIEKAVASSGEALDGFASVAGMSAEEFSAVWGDKENHGPARAIQAFVEGLANVRANGGSVTQTLADLGITGVRDLQLLAGLSNTTDVLSESLQMADDAWNGMSTVMKDGSVEQAGDAAREAGRKSEGFSGQLGILKSNAQQLASLLAEGAVPIMQVFTAVIQQFTQWMSQVPDSVKTATVVIGGLGAAAGPVIVAIGAMGSAITGIGESITKIRSFGMLKKVAEAVRAAKSSAASATPAITGFTTSLSKSGAAAGEAGTKFKVMGKRAGEGAGKSVGVFSRLKGAVSGAASVLGMSTGGLAAVALISAAAIGIAVSQVAEGMRAIDNAKASTEGFADAVKNTLPSMSKLSSAAKDTGDKVKTLAVDYKGFMEETADLRRQIVERNDAAREEMSTLDHAKKVILDYMNSSETLSVQQGGELVNAIKKVNDVCGTQFSVVDTLNGKIADETGAILDNVNAVTKYIAQKQLAIQADALAADAADLYQQKTEAISQRAAAHRNWQDAEKAYRERYGDKRAIPGTEQADEALRVKQLKAEYEGLAKSADEIANAYNAVSEASANMAVKAEGGTLSLKDEIASSGELMAIFKGIFGGSTDENGAPVWGTYFDQFTQALADTNISIEDFASLSEQDIEQMVTMWGQSLEDGSITMKDILASVGLNVHSLGERFSAEMSGMDVTFESLVEALGTDAETLATALSSAGVTAQEMAAASTEGIQSALDSANGDVDAFAQNIKSLGETRVETEIDTNAAEAAEEADGYSESLDEIPENIDTDVDYSEIEYADEAANNLSDDIEEIPDYTSVTVDLGGTAASGISSMRSELESLTSKNWTVNVNKNESGYASGAVVRGSIWARNASGGVFDKMVARIPMHAAGALNGIVARPTLTNIGWTGEAGPEAILHMRNAGGAVIPLSNRRYVRPFARAVAAEQPPASNNSNYNLYLNGQLFAEGVDERTTLGEVGRRMRRMARS